MLISESISSVALSLFVEGVNFSYANFTPELIFGRECFIVLHR